MDWILAAHPVVCKPTHGAQTNYSSAVRWVWWKYHSVLMELLGHGMTRAKVANFPGEWHAECNALETREVLGAIPGPAWVELGVSVGLIWLGCVSGLPGIALDHSRGPWTDHFVLFWLDQKLVVEDEPLWA